MASMTGTGKYVFAKGLKELRFHLCQQGEGSAALRYDLLSTRPTRLNTYLDYMRANGRNTARGARTEANADIADPSSRVHTQQ